jgi:hypothetical protein
MGFYKKDSFLLLSSFSSHKHNPTVMLLASKDEAAKMSLLETDKWGLPTLNLQLSIL